MEDKTQQIIEDIYSKYSEKYVNDAFKILLKLFNNIINNPDEAKFKIFKKTNINLRTKVLLIKENLELLKELGYKDKDEECLQFSGDIRNLKYATYVLTEYSRKIEKKIEEEKNSEERKRQEEMQKQIEEINRQYKEKKLEQEKIRQQILNDRKEMSQKGKSKDSVANKLQYGMKFVKVECQNSGGG